MTHETSTKFRTRQPCFLAASLLPPPCLLPAWCLRVPDECVFTLSRFAAGYDIPMDDVHMALWGIETAAYFASDEALSLRAREATSDCLPLCSSGYQERLQQVFKNLTRDLNNAATEQLLTGP